MASIEYRGGNTYRIIVSVKCRDGTGYDKERKTITLTDGMTEKQKSKEIKRQAMLFETEVKNGTYLDGEKITLKEFIDKWWSEYAVKEYAPATLNPYRLRLDKRIIPALGHLKIAKIQPHHIISFYNNLSEEGIRLDRLYAPTKKLLMLIEEKSLKDLERQTGVYYKIFSRIKNGKNVYYDTAMKICESFQLSLQQAFVLIDGDKKLSNKSIRHHHNLLSGIFTTAVAWNIIQSNPTSGIKLKLLKMNKKDTSNAAKDNFYDDRQIVALFAELEMEPIKYRTIIYLAIDTGLRLSEIAGLEWRAVNFEKKQLYIDKQRQYVSHYGVIEKTPKSDRGTRTISMSDMIVDKLKTYKHHQNSMKFKCGSAWYVSDFIFTHDNGKPIFPNRPSVWFTEFIKRKGLPHITFHGLRHTNASALISEGIDPVTLSERLGHADKITTLNTYSHSFKSKQELAATQMNNFYNRANANSERNETERIAVSGNDFPQIFPKAEKEIKK